MFYDIRACKYKTLNYQNICKASSDRFIYIKLIQLNDRCSKDCQKAQFKTFFHPSEPDLNCTFGTFDKYIDKRSGLCFALRAFLCFFASKQPIQDRIETAQQLLANNTINPKFVLVISKHGHQIYLMYLLNQTIKRTYVGYDFILL